MKWTPIQPDGYELCEHCGRVGIIRPSATVSNGIEGTLMSKPDAAGHRRVILSVSAFDREELRRRLFHRLAYYAAIEQNMGKRNRVIEKAADLHKPTDRLLWRSRWNQHTAKAGGYLFAIYALEEATIDATKLLKLVVSNEEGIGDLDLGYFWSLRAAKNKALKFLLRKKDRLKFFGEAIADDDEEPVKDKPPMPVRRIRRIE